MKVLKHGALLTERADTVLFLSFIHHQRTSCTRRSTPLLKDYVASLNVFSIVSYGEALRLVQLEDILIFSLNLKDVERRLEYYRSTALYFEVF